MTTFRKIILSLIIVTGLMLVGLAGFLGYQTFFGNTVTRHIEAGDKKLASGDYEAAILEYKTALRLSKTDVEVYLALAELYLQNGDVESAIKILEEGIKNTRDFRLEIKLERLQSNQEETIVKQTTVNEPVFDSNILVRISGNTYGDYLRTSSVTDKTVNNVDMVTVVVGDIGAQMIYTNSNEQTSAVINGQISDYALPEAVHLDDVMRLFGGGEYATFEQLSNLDLYGLQKGYDAVYGNVVTFTEEKCIVTIACDENGTIKSSSANSIHPLPSSMPTGSEAVVAQVKGVIIDAQNGNSVSGITIKAHQGSFQDGTIVAESTSDSFGNYTLNVSPGTYVIEVGGSGYSTAYKELYLGVTQTSADLDVVISKKLVGNEMRIVLEWGSTPADLDSHLIIDNGREHVWFNHMKGWISGELVADLDIDDTTAYGPETITIFDTNHRFQYLIYNYTMDNHIEYSDARVTVYLPDGTSQTINISPSVTGDFWGVMIIENNEITVTNSTDVWGYN